MLSKEKKEEIGNVISTIRKILIGAAEAGLTIQETLSLLDLGRIKKDYGLGKKTGN